MRKIILRNFLSPGDIVMLTAAVRDLHHCYPRSFLTDVRTSCSELWEHNPFLTSLKENHPTVETLDCSYPLIDRCNETPYHCLHGFIEFLNDRLKLRIKPTLFKGDIYLSEQEKLWYSQVREFTRHDIPFWIIAAGGKYDITIKWWETQRYQQVVDYFRGKIQFIQVGEIGHHHPRLKGVIDLRGRTNLRELVRLVYHSQGVLCGVTALMHLASAVEVKAGQLRNRPCVVVAGGREPAHWEAYPDHQFIHTNGALACCSNGGCWKARVAPLGDGDERDRPEYLCSNVSEGLPRCMAMITPAEVISRIEWYFQNGAIEYLTQRQARAATRGVLASADNQFDDAPLTLHNARIALERFIRGMPACSQRFAGRGIVICGGGVKYFPSAWVCIQMLRKLGCKLPIQLWHLKSEMDKPMKGIVSPLNVQCVDASKIRNQYPVRRLGGWELKPFALLHSPFKEVLFLDADNVPVRNPEFLFETAQFKQTGAIFWPDFGQFEKTQKVWESCGLSRPSGPEFESGQMVVDKQQCWPALRLALWFNEHSDFYYQHLYGDKETFHLAFEKLRKSFAMIKTPIHPLEGTMCQHDFDGKRLFQHRNTDKCNLLIQNKKVKGFWYEADCRRFLGELQTLWEATGKELTRLKHPERVYDAEFSPDGALIVTSCGDGKVRIWEVATGRNCLEIQAHGDVVTHAEFSHDGQMLATASRDRSAQIFRAKTGERLGPSLKHLSWVFRASFSPDDERLVTACFDRRARLWLTKSGREIPPAMMHTKGVNTAVFSPDGQYIVTGCFDGTARVWDAMTGQPISNNAVLRHSGQGVMSVAFAPDGHRIATGSVDGTVRIWDLAGGQQVPRQLAGDLSGDARRYLVATNTSVKIEGLSNGEQSFPPLHLEQPVRSAGLSEKGDFAVTLSGLEGSPHFGRLQVWNVAAGTAISPSILWTNGLGNALLSSDGRLLLSIVGANVEAIDVASGKRLFDISATTNAINKGILAPNARMIAAVSQKTVFLFHLATRKLAFPGLIHPMDVSSVQFSPDSRLLVTCSADSTVNPSAARIWDTETGRLVHSLNHRDGVLYATFDSRGTHIVTASEDFTARVWSVRTGKPTSPPLRHNHQVQQAMFSRNDRWVITRSSDNQIRVWDAENGDPLTPPLCHAAALRSANFVDDSTLLVSASTNNLLWLWPFKAAKQPLNDLVAFSRLLSGNQKETDENAVVTNIEIQRNWEWLIARYSEDFRVTSAQVQAWHELEARDAEQNEQWRAALFHVNQLHKLRPEDYTLCGSKDRLERLLEKESTRSK